MYGPVPELLDLTAKRARMSWSVVGTVTATLMVCTDRSRLDDMPAACSQAVASPLERQRAADSSLVSPVSNPHRDNAETRAQFFSRKREHT